MEMQINTTAKKHFYTITSNAHFNSEILNNVFSAHSEIAFTYYSIKDSVYYFSPF